MAQKKHMRNFYLNTQADESVFRGSQNHCPEKKKKPKKTQKNNLLLLQH